MTTESWDVWVLFSLTTLDVRFYTELQFLSIFDGLVRVCGVTMPQHLSLKAGSSMK
jgi:hypothetical protein